MLDVPPDFKGVAGLDVKPNAIRLNERSSKRSIEVKIQRFL
jgi:hypothetical protein